VVRASSKKQPDEKCDCLGEQDENQEEWNVSLGAT